VIPYTESMPDVCTYWPPGANDGFGALVFGPPQCLACRWQNVAQLFRTAEGREVVSQAVVYTSGPVVVGGKLYHGKSDMTVPEKTAVEVQQIAVSPSLDGMVALHKAFI
jgi:hypothetical protein